MEVDIFIPCFIDHLYPQTGLNMVKVLNKLGCEVHYNINQTCCGQPAYNGGFAKEAIKVAKKFLNDYSGNRYIVSPSASCVGMVKTQYEYLFGNSSHRVKFKKIKSRLYEFTTFLLEVLEVEDVGASFNNKVTYHDACAAYYGLGIKEGPRKLLSKVKGLELLEMNESETCCGFGGSFAVKMEPISIGMAEQKIDNAMATAAKYIVSTDISCLMHLETFARKQGKEIETMHIADVLAQGY